MALYRRDLAFMQDAVGNQGDAMANFEAAGSLNPSDDLTWRGLSLSALEAGSLGTARTAIEHALHLQQSDVTNELVAARVAEVAGDRSSADRWLGVVVRNWPWITGSIGWADFERANPRAVQEAASDAFHQIEEGSPMIATPAGQELWMSAFGYVEGHAPATDPLARATVAAIRCDSLAAQTELNHLDRASASNASYWTIVAMVQSLAGQDTSRALRIRALMAEPLPNDQPMDPAAQNTDRGFDTDMWGYRRLPMLRPPARFDLPSPSGGYAAWVLYPKEAAARTSLWDLLPKCHG
jgi:hypothetical protein